jgi:hypothetical protein
MLLSRAVVTVTHDSLFHLRRSGSTGETSCQRRLATARVTSGTTGVLTVDAAFFLDSLVLDRSKTTVRLDRAEHNSIEMTSYDSSLAQLFHNDLAVRPNEANTASASLRILGRSMLIPTIEIDIGWISVSHTLNTPCRIPVTQPPCPYSG